MKKEMANRSGLLLTEIMIAILFFSVISSLCLQLFVKSHTITRDTMSLDGAVNQTSSVAEVLRSEENPVQTLAKYYPEMVEENDDLSIFYTREYEPCNEADAIYVLSVTPSKQGEQITDYHLVMEDDSNEDPVYALDVTVYQPLTR